MAKKKNYLKRKQAFSGTQTLLFLIIFAVVGGFAIWKGLAAPINKQLALAFSLSSFEAQPCVEQEGTSRVAGDPGCVTSLPNCVWTADSYISDTAYGYLNPGVGASDKICMVADGLLNWGGEPHFIEGNITAPVNNLKVNISDSAGHSYDVAAVPSGKTSYTYNFCEEGSLFPSYPSIPNTNGGYGVINPYTLTVSNPSTRSVVKGIRASWTIGGTTLLNFSGTTQDSQKPC